MNKQKLFSIIRLAALGTLLLWMLIPGYAIQEYWYRGSYHKPSNDIAVSFFGTLKKAEDGAIVLAVLVIGCIVASIVFAVLNLLKNSKKKTLISTILIGSSLLFWIIYLPVLSDSRSSYEFAPSFFYIFGILIFLGVIALYVISLIDYKNGNVPKEVAPIIQAPVDNSCSAPAESPDAPVTPITPVESAYSESGEEIDLTPYKVFFQDVELKADREYEFRRVDGLMGSMPQAFINKNMPKCPLCCDPVPQWTMHQVNLKTWRGNLILFKCAQCGGVISISIPDIMTATNQFAGASANVTLTNMMAKKKKGKEAKTAYVTFESVGNSGVSPSILGKELRLPDVVAIATRR